ncbi:MAG: ribosomal protein L21 [Rhodobacteraceae bacterium GWE1_64_9]|nr:MAG: ribosomal protein L21 [Rhodobacteraceae bacterium GWE1_64_9]OHC51442.1 MAG: ribosomal protein L21 [Rhodobacteraceae bacterium GWF1_65_7]HBD91645.1 hypothetical protein [Gemmobacter sp.]
MARPKSLYPALLALSLALSGAAQAQTVPAQPAPSDPAPQLVPTDAKVVTEIRALGQVLQIDGVLDVMRAEGVEYGATLRDEMFAGKGGAAWDATVAQIYDPLRMRAEFDAALTKALADDAEVTAAATAFFQSPRGQKILELELEARRALLDEATEAAAKEAAAQMQAEGSPRFEALQRFAATNDLIELNVMGALNSNLAFYKGLSRGGAFGDAMTEEDILADVWAQEADLRAETEEWLWPYLALAYGPLSDEELQAYADFSATAEGERLNGAIFAAFDAIFLRISEELGMAAARQMQGEDI